MWLKFEYYYSRVVIRVYAEISQPLSPLFVYLQIFPGKLVIGLNDSKELCYLHTTNIIAEDILLEATKLAQVKCVERANLMKELSGAYITDRDIPLYLRAPGVRTTGTIINITDAEAKLPSISTISNLISPSSPRSSSAKDKKSSTRIQIVPKTASITVLEEMVL